MNEISKIMKKVNCIRKLSIYRLLRHEMGHARKIQSLRSELKPYIIFGFNSNEITLGSGESQFKNFQCIKYRGINIYFSNDWKNNATYAITDINDRKALSIHEVKKAAVSPVIEEYLGTIIGFSLYTIGFKFLFNRSSYYLGAILALIGIAIMIAYLPSSLPWNAYKRKGSDIYLYFHPEEYYSKGNISEKSQ